MDFLLAEGITETNTIEEKKEVHEEKPQQTELPEEELIDKVISIPIPNPSPSSFGPPIMAPIRGLPMGTIIETITVPASVPTATIESSHRKTQIKTEIPYIPKKETKQKNVMTQGESHEFKTDSNGNIVIRREICDGEINIGPFKSCLKEFTGVTAIGWLAAAAGLIVLWKWLDHKFKK
jgi:hypothetical protein